MNMLRMRGRWGAGSAWLYARVVADGMPSLYDRFVAEVMPAPAEGASVIDVGCGDGQLARRLAVAFPSSEVLGLDLSPAMVARARGSHGDVENLTFEVGNALDLPLDDGSVDLAVSVASIKHWLDRPRGLAEIHRVLRAGGTMCVLEADRGCSRVAARRFAEYWRYVLPGTAWLCAAYFRRFVAGQALSLEELSTLVDGAGFCGVEAVRSDDLPFVVARARKAE